MKGEAVLEREEQLFAVAVAEGDGIHCGTERDLVAAFVAAVVVHVGIESARTEVVVAAYNGHSSSDDGVVMEVVEAEVWSNHNDHGNDGRRTPCWATILE